MHTQCKCTIQVLEKIELKTCQTTFIYVCYLTVRNELRLISLEEYWLEGEIRTESIYINVRKV